MSGNDGEGLIGKVLDFFRNAPSWMFLGFAAAVFAFLYLPAPMLAEAKLPTTHRAYLILAGVLSAALFAAQQAARVPSVIRKRLRRSPLTLTLHAQMNTAYWTEAQQADGRWISGIHLRLKALNTTDALMAVRSVSLRSPRVVQRDVETAMWGVSDPKGSSMFSADFPIPPRASAELSVNIYVAGRLGRPGDFLKAKVAVMDQNGHFVFVTASLWPPTT